MTRSCGLAVLSGILPGTVLYFFLSAFVSALFIAALFQQCQRRVATARFHLSADIPCSIVPELLSFWFPF
jgi:hypothetical protein